MLCAIIQLVFQREFISIIQLAIIEGKNKMIMFLRIRICEALLLLLFCEAKHYDYYYLIYILFTRVIYSSNCYSFHARNIVTTVLFTRVILLLCYYYSLHVRN